MSDFTILRLFNFILLVSLIVLPSLLIAEDQMEPPVEEVLEEVLPFASLPYAARMELNAELLTIWEFIDQGGDILDARRSLLGYLRSPEGQQVASSGFFANSYMYHVLLAKAGLLAGVIDRMDSTNNKGLHWFAHGMLRIYEKKSAQASGNFVKGLFSSLQLEPADYQRLSDSGVEVKYFPSMTSYSNAAFIAGRFSKVSYREQQQILNVAMSQKVVSIDIVPADLYVPGSASYQLQALYYNLAAFLVLEGYNDLYAIQEFSDQPNDLFNVLNEAFGFDAREIFERY